MTLFKGDAIELLKSLDENSIDLCLTDPPYFLDGLGDDWDPATIERKKPKIRKHGTISGLPKGMKFDPKQGKKFQEFMNGIAKEVYRVLKPGAFFISFSQARLYHRMTVAVEDQGFEIRDMLGWTYEGQAKAFSQDHIIKKQKWSDDEKESLIEELNGWKTPQLKPCIEPMCLAQKPTEGKFIDNWKEYQVGLLNTAVTWQGKFPGNIIQCAKPTKSEKGEWNTHISVKPLALIEHLIKLFTVPDAVVLDPFLGSGTTLVACKKTQRIGIGAEINPEYHPVIEHRTEIA